MKLLCYIIFLLSFTSSAQVYVPFVSTSDSSDIWFDVASCTDFNCYETRKRRYTIEGDTLIGGYNYAKLKVKEEIEHGADQSQWCSIYTDYNEYYVGAIRETGKIIYFKPEFETEYTAYNFNLTVGDTIPAPNNVPGNESLRVIDSIDQVLVNGNYRNRYWFGWHNYIVEGIGASTGLFNTAVDQSSTCWYSMICYTEYGNSEVFQYDCNYNLGLDETEISTSHSQLVKIVDYLGREVEYQPNTPLIYIYSDGSTEKIYHLKE